MNKADLLLKEHFRYSPFGLFHGKKNKNGAVEEGHHLHGARIGDAEGEEAKAKLLGTTTRAMPVVEDRAFQLVGACAVVVEIVCVIVLG